MAVSDLVREGGLLFLSSFRSEAFRRPLLPPLCSCVHFWLDLIHWPGFLLLGADFARALGPGSPGLPPENFRIRHHSCNASPASGPGTWGKHSCTALILGQHKSKVGDITSITIAMGNKKNSQFWTLGNFHELVSDTSNLIFEAEMSRLQRNSKCGHENRIILDPKATFSN